VFLLVAVGYPLQSLLLSNLRHTVDVLHRDVLGQVEQHQLGQHTREALPTEDYVRTLVLYLRRPLGDQLHAATVSLDIVPRNVAAEGAQRFRSDREGGEELCK